MGEQYSIFPLIDLKGYFEHRTMVSFLQIPSEVQIILSNFILSLIIVQINKEIISSLLYYIFPIIDLTFAYLLSKSAFGKYKADDKKIQYYKNIGEVMLYFKLIVLIFTLCQPMVANNIKS